MTISVSQQISNHALLYKSELTPFAKSELMKFHVDFHKLNRSARFNRHFRASAEEVARLPFLSCNPFKDQIVKLFSDRDSMVSFDDFLDMMIVMHPKTQRHIKLAYLFAIYDFDGDGVLNHADLMHVIHRITGGTLSQTDREQAASKVLQELDFDDTHMITLEEFEYFSTKCPDFEKLFSTTQNTAHS